MNKNQPIRARNSAVYTQLEEGDSDSETESDEEEEKEHESQLVRNLKEQLKKFKVIAEKYYDRYHSDETFQQQFNTYAMFGASLIIFALYLLSSNGQVNSMLPSSSSSSNLAVAKSNTAPVTQMVELTKREKEIMEGLDIDDKYDYHSLKRKYTTDVDLLKKAQLSSRKKLSAKDEQCFKSSPPTIRRSSDVLSYYTPRKVFDLPVLQRSLKKVNAEQTADLKKADLVLKGQPRVTFRQLNKGKTYYDMVSALGRIGSKKKTQLATLRNHVKKFGCSFESLFIQPLSFDMNKPSDCQKLFSYPDHGKMWVFKSCKNGEGSKGAGIEVVDTLSAKRREFGNCVAGEMNYVAQEYIERPLLLDNKKFDMRAYLFVASTTPYVVFFNPGYVRRSLAEYKPTSTKKDDVLTNYHVQMTREDFDPSAAMWSFPTFMEYLKSQGLCKACGDIEINLAKIGRLVFDSGRNYYKRFPGSFQIVGLDFMMDANLNLFFIEGNVSPGLGSHKLKWKSQLMDDLIAMMYETTMTLHERLQEFDMRIGERQFGPNGNYWELIVHEKHEQCNKDFKFNPCKELKKEWYKEPEFHVSSVAAEAETEEDAEVEMEEDFAGEGEEDGTDNY